MKYVYIVLSLLLLTSGLYAQRKQKPKIMPYVDDSPAYSAKTNNPKNTNFEKVGKASAITWHFVDYANDARTMANGQINPLSYDEDLHTLLINYMGNAHLGGYADAAPGTTWGSVSRDNGLTWRRYSHGYDDLDTFVARYPSSGIFRPSGSTDTSLAYAVMGTGTRMGSTNDYPYGEANLGANSLLLQDFNDNPYDAHLFHQNRAWYDPNTKIWSTKTNMFWAITTSKTGPFTGGDRGPAIFKSTNLSVSPPPIHPPQFDSLKVTGLNCTLQGDAIEVPAGSGNFKIAIGMIGSFFRGHTGQADSATDPTIGVSYSTDEGVNWTALDTVNTHAVPGLGGYRDVGYWRNVSNFISGGLILDSLGYVHTTLVLEDSATGSPAICELYRDAGGWKGKVVAPISYATHYVAAPTGGANSIDQNGPAPYLSRNKTGSVIACLYTGSDNSNQNADMFVTQRKITASAWRSPTNVTQTAGFDENMNNCAPLLRSDGGNLYTMFLSLAVLDDSTDWHSRTGVYVGEYQLDATPYQHDLSAFSINSPADGYTITMDSTLTGFKATVKNVGEQAQTTSFQVRLRITDSAGTQLYTSTQTIASLGFGHDTTLSFSGSFTPPYLGKFTFRERVITSPQDEATSDDSSATAGITVVTPSAFVTGIHVDKFPCTYTEIPATNGLPQKDDSSMYVHLPFPFVYNGRTYDTLLFSTNGYVQLCDTGKVWGRNANETGSGTQDNSVYVPGKGYNHMLFPWCDDLCTKGSDQNGDTGSVSYATLGSAPNRIFVVQWKNVTAWADTVSFNSDTRLNFQLRLYETTNLVDFIYGPRVLGTFTNSQGISGGSIAVKDSVGGPYHYYDAYKEGYGNSSYLNTQLNPNTNWPGANICYRFFKNTAVKVALQPRWNLIATPVGGVNLPVSQIFPTALSSTTYLYKNGYQLVSVLNNGRGYWTKFGTSQGSFPTTGSLSSVDDSVTTGWNLIGAPDHSVPAPSGGIVSGPVYEYSTGYHTVTTLQPGKGYWAKTTANGILTLGTAVSGTSKAAPENLDIYNSVTIKDKTGAAQTLYFRENTDEGIALENYEMPPVPPQGVFDVRFSSGRMLEAYPQVVKDAVEYGLNTHSLEYPVVVSWNIRNGNGKGFAVVEKENEKVLATHTMSGAGNFTLAKAAPGLGLKVSVGKLVPKEFALGQNYPNPFNPTTKFSVEVPKTAVVDVSVFDILGRKVTTLFNGEKEAGYYTVEWNGLNAENESVASGVFFIRMTSGKFDAVRKVMLMK